VPRRRRAFAVRRAQDNAIDVFHVLILRARIRCEAYRVRGFLCSFAGMALDEESEIPPTAVGGSFQVLSKTNHKERPWNPTHGSGWIVQVLSKKGI
jgi:hypothetical protein